MSGYVTSYHALFARRVPDAPPVERIEIPLIQRDYAQGRDGDTVRRIREDFLDVLHRALTGGDPVGLDFVYGDVENGTLRPLDGQQRLTALFLLHWYLAYRARQSTVGEEWTRFSYATRASARLFCERLATYQPPPTVERLSAWIEDQPWYLHTWRHDPTIQSMLVMLDTMHERFRDTDWQVAWARLVDDTQPAISFHLLPIEQLGLSDDLYIKMNSRGKPLTPFEHFKARFEQVLDIAHPGRVREFALKVDGAWSDVLWPFRGDDDIVDDEFLRYFRFITEVCEWQDNRLAAGDITALAESAYGPDNPKAAANLDFLFRAFDTWVNADIPDVFGGLLTTDSEHGSDQKTVLFGQQGRVVTNLFSACCESYGELRGQNRLFSLPQTLLLYAVLLNRIHETQDFSRRLRILRNLVEASNNEIRLERMPALLANAQLLVVEGTLDGVDTFNQAQVADERIKEALMARCPKIRQSLFRLEDHPLLRGCLAAFELDENTFEQRAKAFHRLFASDTHLPSLTGALLAMGDYSRHLNQRRFLLGSGVSLAQWRDLLADAGRAQLTRTRNVLARLLDALAQSQDTVISCLDSITHDWLNSTVDGEGLEWRWYFVKYAAMREGRSGIYVGSNGELGCSLCMLDKTQMNSWYRDPYLSAIHRESGVGDAVESPWFTGHETQPRWMRLKISGTEIQCLEDGFVLRPPLAPEHNEKYQRVCAAYGLDSNHMMQVPQVEFDGRKLDACDRVCLGAPLVRGLVDAGL